METANYKETTVAGTSWVRANKVQIHNPLGAAPYLIITEERVFVLEGEQTSKDVAALTAVFDVNNPLHLQLYGTLNAIYIEEREKRDNPVVVEPVTP